MNSIKIETARKKLYLCGNISYLDLLCLFLNIYKYQIIILIMPTTNMCQLHINYKINK